jgi:hypothetical protein
MSNEKPIKMCAEKSNLSESKNIKKLADIKKGKSESTQKKLQAAFLKSKVWPKGSTINIGFLENPPANLERTITREMEMKVDNNGIALKLDPIQKQVDEMPVKDAIIYTVCKRFNDFIHPNYKPKSVSIDPNHVPNPLINIKLNFFDPNDQDKLFNPNNADIRISFDPNGGSWSLLGKDCLTEKDKNVATMNFGWFDVPTTLHEICHALGMIHEHSNPNGVPINWATCHVASWASKSQCWDPQTIKDNILDKYKVEQINGSEFDPQSIMLYFFDGKLVCSEGKTDESLESIEKCFTGCDLLSATTCDDPRRKKGCNEELDKCKIPGKGTQQNLRFSKFDVLYLNNTYPTKLTPEEMTVNYFRDEFSETISSSDLTEQLEKTREREKFVLDENFELVDTTVKPLTSDSQTNFFMDMCKEYYENNYFFIILFILLTLYIILQRNNILNSNPLTVLLIIIIFSFVSNNAYIEYIKK